MPTSASTQQDAPSDPMRLLQGRVKILLALCIVVALLNATVNYLGGLPRSGHICLGAGVVHLGLLVLLRSGLLLRRLRALAIATIALTGLTIVAIALIEVPSKTITIAYQAALPALAAHMLGRRAAWGFCALAMVFTGTAYGLEFALHLSGGDASLLLGNTVSLSVLYAALAGFSAAARRVTDQHVARTAEAQHQLLAAHHALSSASRSMQDILDNVAAGFFVIDRDLIVQQRCTASCKQLLGADVLAGRPLLSLLPGLTEGEQAMLRLNLDQVFLDILPPELTLDQMRTDFRIGGRALHMQGHAVRGEGGEVKGVLFTVTDQTELLATQHKERHHQRLIDLLRRRDAFQEFLREAAAQLDGATGALAQGDGVTARRALHTLKGNAGAFGLDDLMAQIHRIEDLARIEPAHVQEVRQALSDFLSDNYQILGLHLSERTPDQHAVTEAQLDRLRALLGAAPEPVRAAVQGWVTQVRSVPASALLQGTIELVPRVAERQGKRVQLRVTGGDTLLEPGALGGVFSALPHVLRNAIDHGIEPPDERGDKPELATLSLSVRRTGGALQIEVRDDGRGIDGEALVRRALAMGRLTAARAAQLSRRERLALIFLDGLSTAREVTDLSGRGVGMAAVQEAVTRCGGTIQVDSWVGRGTAVLLHLPDRGGAASPGEGPALAS